MTCQVHLDGEAFTRKARKGEGFESWLSKARYSSSLKVHVCKKRTLSCTLHQGVVRPRTLHRAWSCGGTPEILVATGRLHQWSLGPWAGSWGREEKRRKKTPWSLNKTHSGWEAGREPRSALSHGVVPPHATGHMASVRPRQALQKLKALMSS